MVRGNNAIPNIHCHKHWNPNSSQVGHVKTFFNQAPQKKARRLRREKKAERVFPRPLSKLRPIVRCMTQRYNFRVRLGRGFSLEECKRAGVNINKARTIGIAVDHRRVNKSEEGLETNVQRLKQYLANVVVIPKGKKAEGAPTPVQNKTVGQLPKAANKKTREAPRALDQNEKKRHIYQYLRKVLRDEKFVGIRQQRIKRKEEKAKEKATAFKRKEIF